MVAKESHSTCKFLFRMRRDETTEFEIAFDQWRSNMFASLVCWDMETPAHFDEASRFVRPDDHLGRARASCACKEG
jgi:hypothetical protein